MRLAEACADPNLLGPIFSPAESWRPSRTLLRALDALPRDAYDAELFSRCAGDRPWPTKPVHTLVDISGRRSGKSARAAAMATWEAVQDYQDVVARGERVRVMVIAADRAQARVVFGYICAHFELPMLAPLVERRLEERLYLTNGVVVEVHTPSFRSVRGYTVVCAVLDEIAFWRGDESSANPDTEIVAALRPAMATVPGARFIVTSTPYWRRGWLFEMYERHFGKDGGVLVWQAPTTVMNPSLDLRIVEDALREDEPRARAEWFAEFRTDVEAFVSLETVRECVVSGRVELPGMRGTAYRAFTDPSGGSADSWTLAIGHRQRDGRIVVDALRERRAPFAPSEVAAEYAALCRAYGIHEVVGDRYAGEWPREAFATNGVRYVPSERNKSELYQALLPVLNGRGLELPDNPRLIAQLVSLERIVSRGGRDSIDHPKRTHDDLANAVAGLVSICSQPRNFPEFQGQWTERHEDFEVVFSTNDGLEFARSRTTPPNRCGPSTARRGGDESRARRGRGGPGWSETRRGLDRVSRALIAPSRINNKTPLSERQKGATQCPFSTRTRSTRTSHS